MSTAPSLAINPSLAATSPPSSPSPTRSRHRGLSYLRHYTQNRSNSRATDDASHRRSRPSIPRSITFPQSPPRNSSGPSTPTSPNQGPEPERNELLTPGSQQNSSSTRKRLDSLRRRGPHFPHLGPVSRPSSVSAEPSPTGTNTEEPRASSEASMTRSRVRPAMNSTAAQNTHASGEPSLLNGSHMLDVNQRSTSNGPESAEQTSVDEARETSEHRPKLPTIRLFPHQDPRAGRPSLHFAPVTRTLPTQSAVIRVGRYSEREGPQLSNPVTPSDAPIGFKSKVVSRKHCEFTCINGQWHIKDVKSSSGTFLNHIRLSQPNSESRLFPVKDGDVVQLGIDFRGGEEAIFRCVKIRVECNRSWQKRPNNFNKSRHAQLQNLAKDANTDTKSTGECSICLGTVNPCQSLFVAACAHVWHFKCIRPMLIGKAYPQFTCPNCRAVTDLEAEVDQLDDEWEEGEWVLDENTSAPATGTDQPNLTNAARLPSQHTRRPLRPEDDDIEIPDAPSLSVFDDTELSRTRVHTGLDSSSNGNTTPRLNGIDIPDAAISISNHPAANLDRIPTPDTGDIVTGEGPLTPRNNAGPFVFDGSAGRASGRRLASESSSALGGNE